MSVVKRMTSETTSAVGQNGGRGEGGQSCVKSVCSGVGKGVGSGAEKAAEKCWQIVWERSGGGRRKGGGAVVAVELPHETGEALDARGGRVGGGRRGGSEFCECVCEEYVVDVKLEVCEWVGVIFAK